MIPLAWCEDQNIWGRQPDNEGELFGRPGWQEDGLSIPSGIENTVDYCRLRGKRPILTR